MSRRDLEPPPELVLFQFEVLDHPLEESTRETNVACAGIEYLPSYSLSDPVRPRVHYHLRSVWLDRLNAIVHVECIQHS